MRECAMGRRSLNEGLELFREFSWRCYALWRSVRVGNLSVLFAHRTLLGHLPGVEFPHDFFPQPGRLARAYYDIAICAEISGVPLTA
jgi:hypothetical protein